MFEIPTEYQLLGTKKNIARVVKELDRNFRAEGLITRLGAGHPPEARALLVCPDTIIHIAEILGKIVLQHMEASRLEYGVEEITEGLFQRMAIQFCAQR